MFVIKDIRARRITIANSKVKPVLIGSGAAGSETPRSKEILRVEIIRAIEEIIVPSIESDWRVRDFDIKGDKFCLLINREV